MSSHLPWYPVWLHEIYIAVTSHMCPFQSPSFWYPIKSKLTQQRFSQIIYHNIFFWRAAIHSQHTHRITACKRSNAHRPLCKDDTSQENLWIWNKLCPLNDKDYTLSALTIPCLSVFTLFLSIPISFDVHILLSTTLKWNRNGRTNLKKLATFTLKR